MADRKRRVGMRTLLKNFIRGGVASIPIFGGWIERTFFGTLDDAAEARKEQEFAGTLTEIRDRLDEQQREAVAVAVVQAGGKDKAVFAVPPRNAFFTGREAILKQLHDALTSDSAAALTQAISGLGGIGKTQTAVEYAYRYRDDYSAVLWAKAETRHMLVSGYVAIARELNLRQKDEPDQSAIVDAVRRWLEDNSGWLLIFDNADTPHVVREFLPREVKGHILLTSRAQVFDTVGIANPVSLEEMPPDDAVAFLFRRTGRDANESDEKAAAEQLASELGYLPLALEQAAAYIIAKKAFFQDYLASYQRLRLELLRRVGPVAGEYEKTVSTTWTMNFREARKMSKAAARVLRMSAFLSPDSIPLELVPLMLPRYPVLTIVFRRSTSRDPLRIDEALEPLTRYSLITRDVQSRTYSIHQLVQEVVKGEMDAKARHLWAGRTVRAINEVFPSSDFGTYPNCERLLPHAKAAAKLIESRKLKSTAARRLIHRSSYFLYKGLQLRGGPLCWPQPVAQLVKYWVFEFTAAASLLHHTGHYLRERAQYAEAESFCRRALEIRKAALSSEHPYVATGLNLLAGLYHIQGRYAEAEPMYKRALKIWEKALSPEHPEAATGLNNLAQLYRAQGRYAKAEPMYKRALEIWEKALGVEHPHVATILNNLAELYRAQGRYAKAEPMYKRALEIREKALSPEHPSVAESLHNLAELYRAEGKYEEAEPMYEHALEIWEKALGVEHPIVATCRKNYAGLLREMGREEEAKGIERLNH